jgi:uncharacterized protein (TIGR01777 family)
VKVLVTGSTGLVGRALCSHLRERGDEVLRFVRRRAAAEDEVQWDPTEGTADAAAFDVDAVVHLAGENIGARRWSKGQMLKIRESRVAGTRLISEGVVRITRRPKVLVSASAIGFYGDRGDEVLDEDAPRGAGFLADVCADWELATDQAVRAGLRVVNPRIGMVLAEGGGALEKMLLPFKLGLGGRIGSGRQWMSWIHIEDLVRVLCRAIDDEGMSGPINAVSPNPVTNSEFTRALGRALHRPTVFPLPAFMARLVMGKMADELLLASTRVTPKRLADAGFDYQRAELPSALAAALKPG